MHSIKKEGKPLFYVYDSYKIPKEEWVKILSANGEKQSEIQI